MTTLLSFDGTNGANPYVTLVQAINGNFYGTTAVGRRYGMDNYYGTIAKLTLYRTSESWINHEQCAQCRMCYLACRALDINAVYYVALEPQHKIEINTHKCTCPTCTICLAYRPAEGLCALESRRI